MTPMMRRNAAWLPEVFNDFFNTDFMPKANATAPAINVKESDKGYTVELAAPGMTKEDFNVHINDEGNLIIKMESKQEKKDEDKSTRYLRREFSYTKYEQTLILPDDVVKDKIAARVENGVLTVELPKVEQQQVKVSRQIEIG
jgi:HSP20 family protein